MFRYELTVENGDYWFEITTRNAETARTVKTFCDWLCGEKVKEGKDERSEENS